MDSLMHPVDRWGWHPSSMTLSGGPQFHREATDEDPPYAQPKIRLGFVAPEVDPITWEGDNA